MNNQILKPQFFILLWNFKIGGIQKHGVLLANYLLSQGFDVTILYKSKEGELIDILDSSVKLLEFSIPSTNSPFRLWQLYRRVLKIIPKGAIVLANGPNNFRQVSRLNFLSGKWTLLYVIQQKFLFDEGLLTFLKKFEMRVLCNYAKTNVIALTEAQKKECMNELGIIPKAVINNFVEYDHNYLSRINRNSPRGVSLGRFAYQKGYDVLIEAMSLVTEEIEIDVYGYGEDLEQYEKRMNELGLKNLHFLPATTTVFETNSKYDFFVSSSRFEGFPLAVLEAFSCGLPVVITDYIGADEVVDESRGILVERENPKSIARGIDQMVRDLKSGRFDAQTIRDSASHYSIAEIISQFLKLAEG